MVKIYEKYLHLRGEVWTLLLGRLRAPLPLLSLVGGFLEVIQVSVIG